MLAQGPRALVIQSDSRLVTGTGDNSQTVQYTSHVKSLPSLQFYLTCIFTHMLLSMEQSNSDAI